MKTKIIPYGHQKITSEDIKAVVKSLRSNFLTQGPKILEFEKYITKTVGAKYAVVVNSGTSALHTAYFASGLGKSDEFITSSMTFAATANAGLYLGAKPLFVDIEKDSGNIEVSEIEKKITKKTKLIVPIHYGGFPVDLEKIYKLKKKYNLCVIEDACHALGSEYKKSRIGDCHYSDMVVLSFHPVKHITTGEGGAILTNNEEYYKKMLMFRSHGITKNNTNFINENDGDWYHEMQLLGFNYRMTDFQAALGLSQIKKLGDFIQKRREIAYFYNSYFKNNPYFNFVEEKADSSSAYHLFPILIKKKFIPFKKQIFDSMKKNHLGVQVHYIPVYRHPYYQKLEYKKGICPHAEEFYEREISIPIYPSMTRVEINYSAKTIKKIFDEILKNKY